MESELQKKKRKRKVTQGSRSAAQPLRSGRREATEAGVRNAKTRGSKMQSRPQSQPHSPLPHVLFYHQILLEIQVFLLFFPLFFFPIPECTQSLCVRGILPRLRAPSKGQTSLGPGRLCGFSTFECGGSGRRHLPPRFFLLFFSLFFSL